MRPALLAVALLGSAAAAQPLDDDAPLPAAHRAIQERAYPMAYEVAASFGLLPVDPYTKQVYVGGALAVHFNDFFAWQIARGGYAFNWRTGLREQLERDFPSEITFEQTQFFVGSQLMLVPFYGKSSLLNRFVIHYEAYVEAGLSVFKTNKSFRPGIDVGGGVRVFQNKYLSYRLELLDTILLTGGVTNALSINLLVALNMGSSE